MEICCDLRREETRRVPTWRMAPLCSSRFRACFSRKPLRSSSRDGYLLMMYFRIATTEAPDFWKHACGRSTARADETIRADVCPLGASACNCTNPKGKIQMLITLFIQTNMNKKHPTWDLLFLLLESGNSQEMYAWLNKVIRV